MIKWLHLSLIVAAGILILVLLVILKRFYHSKTRKTFVVSDAERGQTLQNGITRLHQVSPHHNLDRDASRESNTAQSKKPLFNWNDHPSLITDAVENGWTQFSFTTFMSSSPSVKSTKANLFGVCSSGDQISNINVEINWEVFEGSSDFMQKIRLNPGLKKVIVPNSSMKALSLIRTGLPLPGPCLENSSFPQEAYFEITILPLPGNEGVDDKEKKEKMEGDRIKLIGEGFNAKKIGIDSSGDVISNKSQRKNKVEELRKKDGRKEGILMCVGLGGGGSLPLKLPGSYEGSIGFNSTGSLYLDGTKLVLESENEEWGKTDEVIGCGYNPSQKKVFFTVDSVLVYEIQCKTEEFGYPLYPILAANADIMALVNFGQSPFRYGPANLHRTSNPCFVENSHAFGNEDSKELFSMGRIDAQWFQRSAARSNNNTVNSIRDLEYDQESEGELFEIVLDSSGRSPYTTGYQ
ncbi:hypothetical protein ACJIZ3_025017 [Penstemon smallii]|uniref:SPRY domain-containing protein n=1 Tax=Penstemon smallii TaxID=265156 RepID=A0ABD3TTL1_9LAMI